MAWITVAGLVGKVYRPDRSGCPPLKHACRNCFSCQGCDENRCRVCRNETPLAAIPHPPHRVCRRHTDRDQGNGSGAIGLALLYKARFRC